MAAKGDVILEAQRAYTPEMIHARYPLDTWMQNFTDCSAEKAVKNGGSGVCARRPLGPTSSLSWPTEDLSSKYRVELHALTAGSQHLKKEDYSQQHILNSWPAHCLLFVPLTH